MAKAITSDKFVLGSSADPIRFSFLEIAEPKSFNNDPKQVKKYQATALLDPSNKTHASQLQFLQDQAGKLLKEGGLGREDLKSVCFGRGDTRKKDGVVYEGYAGMVYVQLANEIKPIIGDRSGKLVMPNESQFPYAGAYGIIKGTLWLQNNSWGKRINGNLLTLQFVKPGTAFSANAQLNPDEEFERLPDEPGSSGSGAGAQTAPSSSWI